MSEKLNINDVIYIIKITSRINWRNSVLNYTEFDGTLFVVPIITVVMHPFRCGTAQVVGLVMKREEHSTVC